MKKAMPKLLIFFYLIPWALALVLTFFDSLWNLMYLDWLWIPDALMVITDLFAYYLTELAVFAGFGIFLYYIFFARPAKAVLMTALSFAAALIFPISRYVVRHFMLLDVMYDIGMLDYFYEDLLTAEYLLLYGALTLIAALLVRAFWAIVFRRKPDGSAKLFSIRHPVTLSSVIIILTAILLATVFFILAGSFTGEAFLSLAVEYLVGITRLAVMLFAAFVAARWNANAASK